MRLDDTPGTLSRSVDPRPPDPKRAPAREQQPSNVFAIALERAKLKK